MTNAPPKRPPAGICLPVELVRLRDADTVEVRVPGSVYKWAIRLLDCWAAEPHTDAGRAATEHARRLIDDAEGLYLYVPVPEVSSHLLTNLLGSASFDRLLGHLYLDDTTTLSAALVASGHATATKEGQ